MSDIFLSSIDRICLGAVLEDTVDQLAVLGRIMPSSFQGRPDAAKIVQDEISEIVESQKRLESQFEVLNMQLAEMKAAGPKMKDKAQATRNDLQEILDELKGSNVAFTKSLMQNPLSPDNLAKMQDDRKFAETVLQTGLSELFTDGSFAALSAAVTEERNTRAALRDTVKIEEDGRIRIRQLQEEIKSVKREKDDEIQKRNEMIAHLKDQLQEMKAKTMMEKEYVKKVSEVNTVQTKKKCELSLEEIQQEISNLNKKKDEEIRVNADLELFLERRIKDLVEKLDYWNEKYNKDTEEKKRELEQIKTAKAQDLTKMQDLSRLYQECELVVENDRTEKEKAKRRAEQLAVELKASHQLGPYGKKKKGKGKKGKKSGKKKSGKKK